MMNQDAGNALVSTKLNQVSFFHASRQGEVKSVLDSGSTIHLLAKNQPCTNTATLGSPIRIRTADGGETKLKKVGDAEIATTGGVLQLKKALISESLLGINLISVSKLNATGYSVNFSGGGATIKKDGRTFAKAVLEPRSGLFILGKPSHSSHTVLLSENKPSSSQDALILHRRYGHVGIGQLKTLARGLNLNLMNVDKLSSCDSCLKAKARVRSHSKLKHFFRCEKPGEGWHLDLFTFVCTTLSGAKYALICTDDFSRLRVCYLVKRKSDQIACFKILWSWTETQTGQRIKNVRTDGEWSSGEWQLLKQERGIEQRMSSPDTPKSNGVAERAGGVIGNIARSMLIESSLPMSFMGDAFLSATFLVNLIPSPTSGLHSELVSPFQLFTGRSPPHHLVHVFGCLCYFKLTKRLQSKQKGGKFAARGVPGIFVGYDQLHHGFRIYVPSWSCITNSESVRFIENVIGYRRLVQSSSLQPISPLDTLDDEHDGELDSFDHPSRSPPVFPFDVESEIDLQTSEGASDSDDDDSNPAVEADQVLAPTTLPLQVWNLLPTLLIPFLLSQKQTSRTHSTTPNGSPR